MWTIFDLDDETLLEGATCDKIFEISKKREDRIQKGNLRAILRKFDELQVDSTGKGLILTFDEGNDAILVVDRTVLFFRKYQTFPWPWNTLANEIEENQAEIGFDGET